MTNPSRRTLDRTTIPIERSKVGEFARALFDDDPIFRDPDSAKAAGYQSIPVPPTMSAVIDHWARSTADVAVDLGLEIERLLHGGTSWEYLEPMYAGDTVTATRKVADITEKPGKRGGVMKFLTIETVFSSEGGKTLLRRVDTLIEVPA